MSDTTSVNISTNTWTDLSGSIKRGLLTNRSSNRIIVAEAASQPSADSTLGHVLNPNDDINLNLISAQKLWGLSLNQVGVVSLTPSAGISKDNYFTEDFLVEVNKGNIPGHSLINKIARNPDAGTSEEDVWFNGGVLTPLTAAVTTEAISSSANDAAAGTKARTIKIWGLDGDFNEIEETISMNGLSASVATSQLFLRVNIAKVLTTGTYNAKNEGNIIIRVSGAGATQANIEAEVSVDQKSHYCIPAGKTGYIVRVSLDVDSAKTSNFVLHKRGNTNLLSAPFDPAAHMHAWSGISGHSGENLKANHVLLEKSDVWMETVAGQAGTALGCDYDILLVDN